MNSPQTPRDIPPKMRRLLEWVDRCEAKGTPPLLLQAQASGGFGRAIRDAINAGVLVLAQDESTVNRRTGERALVLRRPAAGRETTGNP